MLGRYKIHRGKRPPDDPLPEGIRQDTRKHTNHVLRPPEKEVFRYLAEPTEQRWQDFRRAYLAVLEQRFRAEHERFDELAALASEGDVFLGCSCPTAKNPDVRRCHTVLALRFMSARFPELDVKEPGTHL